MSCIDFAQISLLIVDCDGVLTAGKIIYDSDLAESKEFSTLDGLGYSLLHLGGLQSAVVTGRYSPALEQRCKELGIKYLVQNAKNKRARVQELMQELGLDWVNIAYMGDDLIDIPLLRSVEFATCPDNAVKEVKLEVDYISPYKGGEGAVRDVIEHILHRKGLYEKTIQAYLEYIQND